MDKKHILIIEDTPAVQRLMSRLLERNGYQVTSCQEAEEVLNVIEKIGRLRLVILDVNLPGMSGYDLFSEIRDRKANVPVLLTSGGKTDKIDSLLKEKGVSFLQKPYNNKKFMEVVANMSASTTPKLKI